MLVLPLLPYFRFSEPFWVELVEVEAGQLPHPETQHLKPKHLIQQVEQVDW